MTAKNEKQPTEAEPQNGNAEAVDQIKKKYGFSSPNVRANCAHFVFTECIRGALV